VEKVIKIR